MNITKDTVVTLSYTVTETTGQVVGRTEPNQPVTALIGHGFLIKGLEKALEGHKKGDE
ncbi:MAG: FKBP-type peptidyl-prolyl cis-trans isomerase, partial [Succinivibrio sp.]